MVDSANAKHLVYSDEIQIIASYDLIRNVTVIDEGSSIKIEFDKGLLSTWDNNSNLKMFNITNFHFHAPSEHTINEKNFDLELHIKHMNDDGTGSVIAVFFDVEEGGNMTN